jgi:hypothetical protein
MLSGFVCRFDRLNKHAADLESKTDSEDDNFRNLKLAVIPGDLYL